LQEAKKEYTMAILFATSWEPSNKKFFLSNGIGCILFSMALSSIWILPSSKIDEEPISSGFYIKTLSDRWTIFIDLVWCSLILYNTYYHQLIYFGVL
jgi:hypothetical protein